MILLVSALAGAPECTKRLARSVPDAAPVHHADGIAVARKLVRRAPGEANVILLDQSSVDLQSPGLDALIEESGALATVINLATYDAERIERDLRLAMRRGQAQRQAAVTVARKLLASEIKSELTQVLIRLQTALRSPSIAAMEPSLKSAFEAAERIREHLALPASG